MKKMKKKPRDRFDGDPGIDLLEKALRGFDDLVRMAVNAAKEQLEVPPTCESCSSPGCCHQLVLLSVAEAFPIARRLAQEGRDSATFKEKLKTVGAEQEKLGRREWWKRAEPCVFLRDGRCSIYDLCPIMCRSYFSWSEVELCQPPRSSTVKTVSFTGVGRAMVVLNKEICDQLELPPGPAYMAVLPRMLAIILECMDRSTKSGVAYLKKQHFMTVPELEAWFGGAARFEKTSSEEHQQEELR